ncbi:Photosystem I P700 chlorophyll a apoprotein A1 [Platanthera zijinensis]|uniref:Photosystem I P700 chlorophyll a apoprotein A1 n=1 Tax=Platanthera zijinensis TaxID=2320716 RepID=A0AAP0C218_9ASPA
MACSIISEPIYVRLFNHCCSSPYVFHAPYPYLAIDYGTQLSLFTHHMWIGGFLIVGAVAHATIFLVRDYEGSNAYPTAPKARTVGEGAT